MVTLVYVNNFHINQGNIQAPNIKDYRARNTTSRRQQNKVNKKQNNNNNNNKIILLYTPFFGDKNWHGFMHPDIKQYSKTCGCKYKNCLVSNDKKLFLKSDAVIFHGRDVSARSPDWVKLNEARPKPQIWVYLILENPYNTPNTNTHSKYFNLTFSYRQSSDIMRPRSRFRKLTPNEQRSMPNVNYAAGKNELMNWFVSHCGTFRDRVMLALEKFGVPMSIAGNCFKNKKRIHCSDKQCLNDQRKFKFYFAAENAFCDDYITEKYWVKPFVADQVPVVLGGANYTKLAIPGSYIDAFQFQSVKQLADYIKMLDGNDTAYNQYFKWKQTYKLIFEDYKGCHYGVCKLCEILNNKNYSYKPLDLKEVINSEKECRKQGNFANEWLSRTS